MKLQIELWRLCASLTCFGISFGLGHWAFSIPYGFPETSVAGLFLTVLCAIFCIVFFAAAIGVLFRRGWIVALTALQAICNFIP